MLLLLPLQRPRTTTGTQSMAAGSSGHRWKLRAPVSPLDPCIRELSCMGRAYPPAPSAIHASLPVRLLMRSLPREDPLSLSLTITVPQFCPLHFTVCRVPQELGTGTLRKLPRCQVSGPSSLTPGVSGLKFCLLWIAKRPLGHLPFRYSDIVEGKSFEIVTGKRPLREILESS